MVAGGRFPSLSGEPARFHRDQTRTCVRARKAPEEGAAVSGGGEERGSGGGGHECREGEILRLDRSVIQN